MNRGWIKLWRCAGDSAVFANAEAWHLFCYLVLNASRKAGKISFNKGRAPVLVEVGAGQLVVSQSHLCEILNLPRERLRNRLKFLSECGSINLESNQRYTVVTICKWEYYQSEQADDNQQTTSRQPAGNQQATSRQPA